MPSRTPPWIAALARAAGIAASFSLAQAPAAADTYLNRSGTRVYEEDAHGSGTGGAWMLLVLAALTFALYKAFQAKWPQHSDALNFNLAWLAALVLTGGAMALFR